MVNREKRRSIANARVAKSAKRHKSGTHVQGASSTLNKIAPCNDPSVISDTESESVQGYVGGNLVLVTDSGSEGETDSEYAFLSSEEGYLSEMDDEDYEADSQALLHEVKDIQDHLHTPYKKLQQQKAANLWKEAKENRALGYLGTSARTKRRQNKKARDDAATREKVKTS